MGTHACRNGSSGSPECDSPKPEIPAKCEQFYTICAGFTHISHEAVDTQAGLGLLLAIEGHEC